MLKGENEFGMNAIDTTHYLRAIVETRFQRYLDKDYTVCDGFSDGYDTAIKESYNFMIETLEKVGDDAFFSEIPEHKRVITANGKKIDITDGGFSIWIYKEACIIIANKSDHFTIHLKKHNWLNKKVYHAIQDIVINMFRSNTDTEFDLAYLLNGPVKRYYEYKLNHRKHKK